MRDIVLVAIKFHINDSGNLVCRFEGEESDPAFTAAAALALRLNGDTAWALDTFRWCADHGFMSTDNTTIN